MKTLRVLSDGKGEKGYNMDHCRYCGNNYDDEGNLSQLALTGMCIECSREEEAELAAYKEYDPIDDAYAELYG